ncbi:putative metalloprotease CJM1_0395 family protein [Poseidonibacter lekithochrous]|uniref:putative metalloprotease CJM1_0395 family protein n=1 Tax=Poseidonibacter lekithochrous TaxID=1904463 RepID=UPI0008FC8736|nr:putative metalloprotease CJM1_0395 family protein [Poseidonibacter lekithochrous]QKJ23145.1 SprA family protein [Poseidonibacter lekithochrous]
MQLANDYLSVSSIYQQIATKKSELAAIDKKEEEQSLFEKKDTISLSNDIGGKNYDENDYTRVLEKFKTLDAQTKAHEQQHAAAGDTKGAISYNYQTGPDGKLYATGGHVRLDTSIPQDEEAALAKLDKLANAAGAPSELSGADAAIARAANLNKMLILNKQEEGKDYANNKQ